MELGKLSSMNSLSVGIALVGLGHVGRATCQLFEERRRRMEAILGAKIRLLWLIDRHPRNKTTKLRISSQTQVARDFGPMLKDNRVNIVVELIGGLEDARRLILEALANSKDVITANKLLLATCWEEIHQASREHNRAIYYEASVASAIPIIRSIREGLASSKIMALQGILNGTTNFILTRMIHEGLSYGEALKKAQALGLAEAKPTLDIEGIDTAHKLSILASLISGSWVAPRLAHIEGISGLNTADILFAQQHLGRTCRLLGLFRREDNGQLDFRVHPCLIPTKHPFATVHDEYNAIWLKTDRAGDLYFQGKGAGALPAANAVLSDLADAAKRLLDSRPATNAASSEQRPKVKPMDEVSSSYYLRLDAKDRPGVLAKIAKVMARAEISIAQVHQGPVRALTPKPGRATIILVTHRAKERAMRQALTRFKGLGSDVQIASRLRFEGDVR